MKLNLVITSITDSPVEITWTRPGIVLAPRSKVVLPISDIKFFDKGSKRRAYRDNAKYLQTSGQITLMLDTDISTAAMPRQTATPKSAARGIAPKSELKQKVDMGFVQLLPRPDMDAPIPQMGDIAKRTVSLADQPPERMPEAINTNDKKAVDLAAQRNHAKKVIVVDPPAATAGKPPATPAGEPAAEKDTTADKAAAADTDNAPDSVINVPADKTPRRAARKKAAAGDEGSIKIGGAASAEPAKGTKAKPSKARTSAKKTTSRRSARKKTTK